MQVVQHVTSFSRDIDLLLHLLRVISRLMQWLSTDHRVPKGIEEIQSL
jgi:hypothetical protein